MKRALARNIVAAYYELVQADGLTGRVAVVEVIALQDAGHGEVRQQLEQGLHVQIEDPLGVVAQDGLLGIEDFEGLVHVGLGVLLDLVAASFFLVLEFPTLIYRYTETEKRVLHAYS